MTPRRTGTGFGIALVLHALVLASLLRDATTRKEDSTGPIVVDFVLPSREAERPAPRPMPAERRRPAPTPSTPVSAPSSKPPPLLAAPADAPAPLPSPAAPAPQPATPPSTSTTAASSAAVAASAAAAPVETPPIFDAKYLDNPPPAYPALSRRMGETGRVMLRVLVSMNGAAEDIQVRSSSGHPRLDEAARDTVRRWRFVPARRGADPVSAWVLIPISFRLD